MNDAIVPLVSANPTGMMEIMGSHGDLKSTWDKDNPDEVRAAREQFERLTKRGHIAFRVKGKGERGEIMREFDANAEAIILSPPVSGG